MRFLTLFKPAKVAQPTPEMMAAMGQFIEETRKAGILLATDGILPGGKSARFRLSKGEFTATDGPFAEAKELIGGYAILQVKSMQELTEISRRFLAIAGDGESEAHEMFGG
jgi:hypothetical protein